MQQKMMMFMPLDLHVDVPVGAERPGALLDDEQPLGDRPAGAHEPADRTGRAQRNVRPPAERRVKNVGGGKTDQAVEGAKVDGTARSRFVSSRGRRWRRWACRSRSRSSTTPDSMRVELSGEGGELLLRRRGRGARCAAADRQHGLPPRARRTIARSSSTAWITARRKDAELRQMARFMMEKAKTTGVPQEMGPLNPYARRLVHLTVAEDPADVVGEHRRRVPEDGHHLDARGDWSGTKLRVRLASSDLRDVTRMSPPSTTPSSRSRRRPGRGGIGVVRVSGPARSRRRGRACRRARAARAAPRDACAAFTRRRRRDRSRRPRTSSLAALLHRRRRRRDQRARQPGAAARDRRGGDARGRAAGGARRIHVARVSPAAGSISCRRRRCGIWLTRSRRCRRAPRSISSKGRSRARIA